MDRNPPEQVHDDSEVGRWGSVLDTPRLPLMFLWCFCSPRFLLEVQSQTEAPPLLSSSSFRFKEDKKMAAQRFLHVQTFSKSPCSNACTCLCLCLVVILHLVC